MTICRTRQPPAGFSNVSFSFRGNNGIREAIHTVFLYHAVKAGLSMGIVNAGQLGILEDLPADIRERVEDLVLNRREDATEGCWPLRTPTPARAPRARPKISAGAKTLSASG